MEYFALSLTMGLVMAAAQVGSFVIEMEQSETSAVFRVASVRPHIYEQRTSEGRVNLSVQGTGAFENMTNSSAERLNDVPGVTSEGHSSLRLHKRDRSYSVATDYLTFVEVMEERIELPLQVSSEAKFVQGNWNAYQKGKPVTLEMTDQGTRQSLEAMIAKISVMFAPIGRQLEAANMRLSEQKTLDLDIDGVTRIDASLNETTVITPPFHVKVRFDVYTE